MAQTAQQRGGSVCSKLQAAPGAHLVVHAMMPIATVSGQDRIKRVESSRIELN